MRVKHEGYPLKMNALGVSQHVHLVRVWARVMVRARARVRVRPLM